MCNSQRHPIGTLCTGLAAVPHSLTPACLGKGLFQDNEKSEGCFWDAFGILGPKHVSYFVVTIAMMMMVVAVMPVMLVMKLRILMITMMTRAIVYSYCPLE